MELLKGHKSIRHCSLPAVSKYRGCRAFIHLLVCLGHISSWRSRYNLNCVTSLIHFLYFWKIYIYTHTYILYCQLALYSLHNVVNVVIWFLNCCPFSWMESLATLHNLGIFSLVGKFIGICTTCRRNLGILRKKFCAYF